MPSDNRGRVMFEDMYALLLEDYRLKQNRSDPSRHVKNLAACFAGAPADEIEEERIRVYSFRRLEEDGARPATLRRELAVLHRMLRLASPRLHRMPMVRMPRVDNTRQGYFEEAELQRLLPHLPPHARNLVEFLYLTGWRSGEAFRLQWRDVDWQAGSAAP